MSMFSENFDGPTPPALPSGWNAGGSVTFTTATAENGITPTSSPNMLKGVLSASGVAFFTYGTRDTNGGNVVVVGAVNAYESGMGRNLVVGVTARGSAATLDATTSCYAGWCNLYDGSVGISKVVAGTDTALAGPLSPAAAWTGWPILSLSCVGTTISLTAQDSSTGQYLTAAGAFQAGPATCLSVTDSTLSGAGYCGAYLRTPGALFTGYVDTWSVATPPANGTAAVTLGGMAGSGSGTFSTTATAAATLGGMAAVGSGTSGSFGSASIAMAPMAPSAAGTFTATASIASTLGGMAGSGAGTSTAAASASPSLGSISAAGSGGPATSGSASITLTSLSPAASAFCGAFASGPIGLGAMAGSAAGTSAIGATAAITLASLTGAATGTFEADGSAAITLGVVTLAGTGTFGSFVAASLTLAPLACTGSVLCGPFAVAGIALGSITASGSGSFATTAAPAIALGPIAAAGSAFNAVTAIAAIDLRPFQAWGGNYPVYYHIYAGASGGVIDYDTPVATTGGLSWASGNLSAGTWKFGVRASNVNGIERNLDCSTAVIVAADGSDVTARPAPPSNLRAHATAGGSVVVAWSYASTATSRRPTEFRVYAGVGAPYYASPVAVKTYGSSIAGAYQVTLTGLTSGSTYSVGVRAYNPSGGEEANTATVQVVADADGPAPVLSLSAAAVV